MDNGYLEELGTKIQTGNNLLAFGGQTKSALLAKDGITALDIGKISGILEYQPDEYTFTAYAGTSLYTINQMLAEHDQFMPFDPPFIERGGTLGGTVASNLNGPGRFRYGGVRDFILGVKYLDYQAKLVRSGGKVVKNAAGFDISKLMVGSLGGLGAMIELSFKVFPKPPEYRTVISRFSTLEELLDTLVNLTANSIELFCLDIEPASEVYNLTIRLGGIPDLFPKRIERLKQFVGDIEILEGDHERSFWDEINEFSWVPEDTLLIKVPITPSSVETLDDFLSKNEIQRRYSVGANVAWIAWSKPVDIIDKHLKKIKLAGLTILGQTDQIRLGFREPDIFFKRIKNALDPIGKWVEI